MHQPRNNFLQHFIFPGMGVAQGGTWEQILWRSFEKMPYFWCLQN